MKSVLKILSLFFVCILVSCGNLVSQSEKVKQTEKSKPTNFVLRMERTACLGNCPVYKLEVLQNGQFLFEQLIFSEKDAGFSKSKDKIEKTLNQEKINQLIAEIESVNFFSLSDDVGESGNCATDHSSVILSIRLNGNEKKINHDLGCSGTADLKKLEDLENKIDEIVETKRWIGERK
jgi:hypothetical protein